MKSKYRATGHILKTTESIKIIFNYDDSIRESLEDQAIEALSIYFEENSPEIDDEEIKIDTILYESGEEI